MKTQLFYSDRQLEDFESLVASYNSSEFASPSRSTVPLLVYWQNIEQRIGEFYNQLGISVPNSAKACFEYAVPVQGGKGKASHTDLMVLSKEHALAIEAKYTEPPYATVQKWLGKTPTENKYKVLDGWLSLISEVTGIKLATDDVSLIAYQLIHRTASACYLNTNMHVVVYQCFGLDHPKSQYYEKQLSELSELIKHSHKLKLFLMVFPIEKSTNYQHLVERWKKGERDLSRQVKRGIIGGVLLNIGYPKVIKI